jgi:RNA-binding protein Nova
MSEEVADSLAKTELQDPEVPAEGDDDADEAVADAPAADDADGEATSDQKVVAKFLVSNAAAGSVIGKGGSNIAEFQTQSSARIQLSRANEYFPGTSDRVMLISGTVGQVLTALHLVLAKMSSEKAVQDTMMSRDGTQQELRLLVPAALCGSIIGKGGATIRQFAEDSKAAIGLSPQDRMPPGVADRTVRITGEDLEQLMRATALILTKLSQNPNYSRFTSTSVSYGGYGAGGYAGGYGGRGAAAAGPPPEVFENGPQGEAVVAVPDRAVGAIIGKGGEVINQIKNVVGVRIRVSGRDEYIEGTRDRNVTISGPKEAVAIAEQLIRKKMDAALSGTPARD